MATRIKKNYFKNCPKCGKEQGYTSVNNRNRAVRLNAVCLTCAKTGKHSEHHQSIRDACTKMYGKKIEYTQNYFRNWGKQVKARDNYTCARCNTVATGNSIHAHHIVPKEFFPETALNISNGITLCQSCHQKIHNNLDKIAIAGTKLTQVGFQDHAKQFIAVGKASSQSIQTPLGYKSVFSPSVTIVKE